MSQVAGTTNQVLNIPDLRPKAKSFYDIPKDILSKKAVKMYIIGALVWDYAETVIDIAAQMKLGGETKRLSRAIRVLQRDYKQIRAAHLDNNSLKREWELAELFESLNSDEFKRLCHGLCAEIHRDTELNRDYAGLVEAVQMALTLLDTLFLYAAQCDSYILEYYPQAPHSILPDHFRKLRILLPEFAGDCYDNNSQTRSLTAKILLNKINEIELYPNPHE